MITTDCVLLGDNLPLLEKMPDACVDLCYADPPFNTGDSWSAGEGGYLDIYKTPVSPPKGMDWIEKAFDAGSVPYACYMAHRLIEIHRVLKETGHFFLHCDWRESAHLQVLVNFIFGKLRLKNEIIWSYPTSYSADQYSSKISCYSVAHNTLLWYARSTISPYYPQYTPFTMKQIKAFFHHKDSKGRRFRTRAKMGRSRIYFDDVPGIPMTDVWELGIAKPSERVGYPTQKPLALLNRVISCSTKEGDVVLDPFCGSGTTLLSARNLGRRYIGIDLNDEAIALAERRLGRLKNDGCTAKTHR